MPDQSNKKINPQLEASWKAELIDEFGKPYFQKLKEQLVKEKKQGIKIYPPGPEIFNAFNTTPFDKVKVVIIGQDPYHGPNQAHGLCFSVAKGVHPPPSLINIFKEIRSDLGIELPNHGSLLNWAEQGVFLLNTILTVQASKAASHRKFGWQFFTTAAIQKLSEKKEGLVFLLWGKYAQEKVELIDRNKHHVLMAAHPSPFSAHSGFFGCKHFSKTNEFLRRKGLDQIDWSLGI